MVTPRLHEMDLTRILAGHSSGRDARAFDFRPARVQDDNRDIAFDGWQDGRRMKHFSAEIRHFSSFRERNTLDLDDRLG